MKISLLNIWIFLCFSVFAEAQNWTTGVAMFPLAVTRMHYDKPFLIVGNQSYRVQPNIGQKFHLDFSYYKLATAGWWIKYQPRAWYARLELAIAHHNYRYRSDEIFPNSSTRADEIFPYSSVQIPVSIGVQLRRGRRVKYSLETGPIIELGKSDNGVIVFYPLLFAKNKSRFNLEYSTLELEEQSILDISEMLSRKRNYTVYGMLDLGIHFFDLGLHFRYKTNVTQLQSQISPYNANYTRFEVIEFRLTKAINIKG